MRFISTTTAAGISCLFSVRQVLFLRLRASVCVSIVQTVCTYEFYMETFCSLFRKKREPQKHVVGLLSLLFIVVGD